MASSSLQALNKKLETENLFNSQGATEIAVRHVSPSIPFVHRADGLSGVCAGRDGSVQVRQVWQEQDDLLPDADEECRRADDGEHMLTL